MEKSTRSVAVKKEARRLKLGPKIQERQSRVPAMQEAPEAGLLSEMITLKTERLGWSQRSWGRGTWSVITDEFSHKVWE